MINRISNVSDPALFRRLIGNAEGIKKGVDNLRNIGLTQKDILLSTIAQHSQSGDMEFIQAAKRMYDKLYSGASFSEAVAEVKHLLPNSAAIKQTSLGTAVMAEGWSKPVVFPKDTKFLGWIDLEDNNIYLDFIANILSLAMKIT